MDAGAAKEWCRGHALRVAQRKNHDTGSQFFHESDQRKTIVNEGEDDAIGGEQINGQRRADAGDQGGARRARMRSEQSEETIDAEPSRIGVGDTNASVGALRDRVC